MRDFKTHKKLRDSADAFIKKVEKLNLKTDDWDAVSFFQTNMFGSYTFTMIKFVPEKGKDSIEYAMNKEGLGHIFHMIDDDGEGNIILEEAVLGDPTYIFLNNYIRAGRSGYLIKKCPQGTKMANEIFEDAKKSLEVFKQMFANNVATKV
jgi:phage FluMu protein Com